MDKHERSYSTDYSSTISLRLLLTNKLLNREASVENKPVLKRVLFF